jgi:hypothetical protein
MTEPLSITRSPDTSTQPIQIDFLYWEECPSHERALQLLEEVIEQEGVEAEIRIQRVDTEEDVERFQFPGSPTIRVDGCDIDEASGGFIGFTCRAYRQPNGKISPLPSREAIVAALQSAARRSAA